MEQKNIRNFSIIAHIDHGKSTIADRILEITGAISQREMQSQLLDSMDIERERGITIKLNAVQLKYNYGGEDYTLHLIDTPGHVDFSYEVSRSLAACEGAVLVVDAAQGIEAQTLANVYLALENNLEIIPVINKIDLPNADIPKVKKELTDTFGFKEEEIILTSAKTGEGIKELVDAIIERIPAPTGDVNEKLQALVFDSYFDPYKGVIALVRIVNGKVKVKDKILMMATGASHDVVELGVHNPKEVIKEELVAGEVGYISGSVKSIGDIKVGDTITLDTNPSDEVLPGYKPMKPMVFCGLYPIESNKYPMLREALEKLKLNDAALEFEPETSKALGFGFRCGFLGLLHMEITLERIRREFNIEMIATSPSPIMELCQNKRGNYINMEYLNQTRVNIHYEIPLSEIVYDFFDKLKSVTRGYASFDYEIIGYKQSDLVKMDILLNGAIVDALSLIVHKDFAYKRGRAIVEALRKQIPRQMFEVPVQAVIGSKAIARADIKAMRKNVLAKCYGGDISRKRKLLEKQKEGKKKMKMVGNVEVPQEAFLAVLSMDEE